MEISSNFGYAGILISVFYLAIIAFFVIAFITLLKLNKFLYYKIIEIRLKLSSNNSQNNSSN